MWKIRLNHLNDENLAFIDGPQPISEVSDVDKTVATVSILAPQCTSVRDASFAPMRGFSEGPVDLCPCTTAGARRLRESDWVPRVRPDFFFFEYLCGCIGSSLHPVRSLVVAHELSRCVSQAPEHRGSVVAYRFSFSTACGIIVPHPRTEPTSLHCKADS